MRLIPFAAFVGTIGLAGVAMAGDVPGHDTCEVGGGADDIYNLSAFFDDNGNSDPTDDVIVVEMKLCDDPTGTRTKYRVHFDHTPPLFSVDGTSEDRNGDTVIDGDDFCATTSDDTMMRRGRRGGNKDTGPGIIEFIEENGMFFLVYTVLVDDLNSSLLLDDTIYIWADTQLKGIIDRAPDTDALSDGCSKPEVEVEVVALTLSPPDKVVFLTSSTHLCNLGGLAGADAICQGLANAAGLGGTFLAWLADGTASPSTRFVQSTVPYVRTDGVRVADDWSDLTTCTDPGCLQATINHDEAGNLVPFFGIGNFGFSAVWTAVRGDGTHVGPDCNSWTVGTAQRGIYNTFFTEPWTFFRPLFGTVNGARLYCFEQ